MFSFGQQSAPKLKRFIYRTPMTDIHERRRDQRFTLAIPIALWTPLPEPFRGITRDVSTCGVYLYLQQPVLMSAQLTIMMRMPNHLPGHSDTVIWARGKAVRVELRKNNFAYPWGVATWIEGYTFVGEESDALRHSSFTAA